MKHRSLNKEAGFTLLEVLVAILILSFGLLGFVGLQARAMSYSGSAEDTNRAALLANEMGSLLITRLAPGQAASVPDISSWVARVHDAASGGLPNGVGTVTNVGNIATITITWSSPNAASGASPNKYVTEVINP